ncbi:hypothetical protein [Pasteuria penetrans]|uniref:hypothetical protein n=1 Tax=Pasteuria penetrans TaxID=86005 RepID=UPI000FAC4055|nr:hypothetical protein [Pasteuria penetrans]
MSSITVGVYLGKKDRIVRYWYEILPKGQFPMLVKYCMQSYLLRKKFFPLHTICEPQCLKAQMDMRSEYVPTQRNVTFTPEDGLVYKWVKELESGYRSEEIKTILRETVVHTLLSDNKLNSSYPQPQVQPQRSLSAPSLPSPVYSVDPRTGQSMAYGTPPGYAAEEASTPQQHMVPNSVPNSDTIRGEDSPYQTWDKPPSQPIETAPIGTATDPGCDVPGNQGIAGNSRVRPILL